MTDQPAKPPKRQPQDLPKLLSKLRAAGVTEAHFHEDGKLKAVAFGTVAPVVDGREEPQNGVERQPPTIEAARAALDVLSGRREALDIDKQGKN